MIEKEKIISETNNIFSKVVEYRRHFHQYPELSLEEKKTSEYICSILDELKIQYKANVGGYGVVAIINGKEDGKCIALRADMDALKIDEENDIEYKSKNKGVMHACGHDAHIASLLGVAHVLNSFKSDFKGSVKLIFQPSEETFPGGAIKMIEEGVLENPKVDAIVAQHVLPQFSTGMVGMRAGAYMASTDEIYITVNGRGGHGATPEINIDPTVIAAQILIALQQVCSRFASPAIPTVLSFGKLIADGRTNIIPDKAIMEGTIRTFDENWRKRAHEIITSIATNIAKGFGANCDVRIEHGYPFVVNDEQCVEIARQAAIDILGEKNIAELPIRMTAEDFSYFSHEVPGILYRLGTTNPQTLKPDANLHSPRFDIDEKALSTSVAYMSFLTLSLLEKIK